MSRKAECMCVCVCGSVTGKTQRSEVPLLRLHAHTHTQRHTGPPDRNQSANANVAFRTPRLCRRFAKFSTRFSFQNCSTKSTGSAYVFTSRRESCWTDNGWEKYVANFFCPISFFPRPIPSSTKAGAPGGECDLLSFAHNFVC